LVSGVYGKVIIVGREMLSSDMMEKEE